MSHGTPPDDLARFADPATRAAVLFELYAETVEERLARRHRWVKDPDWVADAVADAVMEVARTFDTEYDPGRAPVVAYLYEVARQNLRTKVRTEKRLKAREGKKAHPAVTGGEPAAPTQEERPDPDEIRQLRDRIAHTDAERAALDVWLEGVTAPAEVARRLGYGDDAAGAAAARTLLARLRKRIQREKERLSPDTEDDP